MQRSSLYLVVLLILIGNLRTAAQVYPHLHNVYHRAATLLNGNWHYIIDPYETGYRNVRTLQPHDKLPDPSVAMPFFINARPTTPSDRVEYSFEDSPTLSVPGDWNHQNEQLLYYEGTIWYKTEFNYKLAERRRLFLHFGAVNYRADVYFNGQKLGAHEGGFDPFVFEITDRIQSGNNLLVVRVDNRRERDRVPALSTDWWNYGGITRDVKLIETPPIFIRDYRLQLDTQQPDRLRGHVQLDGANEPREVILEIPDADWRETIRTNAEGFVAFDFPAPPLERWSVATPRLYEVKLHSGDDRLRDRIGFRTLETKGNDILLNGKSIFLRGISLHEENPFRKGRAYAREDAELLFGWAKELNCNMVRLAHYPHNEHMPRLADELGLLLWEEVPVYWGIDYQNPEAFAAAEHQLRTLIRRDKNRASVIIWSVANETPAEDPQRLPFLNRLADIVREEDSTRLVSAALDRTESADRRTITVDDPFAQTSDLIAVNEYIGWYDGLPDRAAQVNWDLSAHDKPFFVSEFGAGALYGYHDTRDVRWTEEYQNWMYEETLRMLEPIPSLRGMTPWILVDFRSPRRTLPVVQDGWNRKGVISDGGFRKMAFVTLRDFYAKMRERYPD